MSVCYKARQIGLLTSICNQTRRNLSRMKLKGSFTIRLRFARSNAQALNFHGDPPAKKAATCQAPALQMKGDLTTKMLLISDKFMWVTT